MRVASAAAGGSAAASAASASAAAAPGESAASGGSAASAAGLRMRRLRLPDVGARMPGWVVCAALALVGAALCVDRLPAGFALVVGLALAGVAAVLPRFFAAWALIAVLAATQFAGTAGLDPRTLVLLAGLHLIHVLASLSRVVPARSWVQLAALRRPALRFVAIQVPVQLVAVVVLGWLVPTGADAAPAGVLGAAALVGLTLLVALPLLRRRAPDSGPLE